MSIELHCPYCPCHFSASPDTPAAEIVNRMMEEGPWLALGEGATFEDMVGAALASRGKICCPECRQPLAIRTTLRSRGVPEPFSCR